MNRVASFLSRFVPQRIVAHYEAAQASKDRSTLSTTYQDPDKDMTPAARRKIGSKARYFVRNSALFAGIVERMVTYVVGAGIHPEPVSRDAEFNKRAQAAWDKHKDNLEIETGCSWDELVAIIYESGFLVDNGIYSILDPEAPRIQLVEAHRLAPAVSNDPFGGIKLNEDGSPKSYRFLIDPTPDAKLTGKAEEIAAEYVVPHYFQKRARQYWGLTIFAPALNKVHDIEDLLAIEIPAAKEVCSTINVIRTKTGEAPTSSLAFQRFKTPIADSKDNATNSLNERQDHYKKTFTPTTKYIGENDEFKQHVPERPSPTWVGMMDFLNQCVCMPLGMPPSTLLQIKVGGHDSRRDLAAAARVIERHQRRLTKQLKRIYEHVLKFEFEESELPEDWNAVEWQFAGSITGDAGRMAQQDREDVAMGTNSLRNYCGANGLGGVEQYLRTRAHDITLRDRITAEINDERAKLKLPPLLPAQIFNFDHKSQPTVPPELIAAAAGVEQTTKEPAE